MTTPSSPITSGSSSSSLTTSVGIGNIKDVGSHCSGNSSSPVFLQNLPAVASNITSTTFNKRSEIANRCSSNSTVVSGKSGSSVSSSNSTICHFLDLPSPSLSTISKPLSTTTDTTEPDSCAPYIGSSSTGSLFATSSSCSTSSPPGVTTITLSAGNDSSGSIPRGLSLPPSAYPQHNPPLQQCVQSSSGTLTLDIEDVNILRQHQQQLHQQGLTSSDDGVSHDVYDLPSPTITSTMMMLPPQSQQKQPQQQQQLQQTPSGGGNRGSSSGGGSNSKSGGGSTSSSSSNSGSSSSSSFLSSSCAINNTDNKTSEFFSKGSNKGNSSSVDDEDKVLPDTPDSSKRPFVPCKVCGDKASGYHYGVTSCEGCKGFFRRSIQKQIEYRCLRDGKCMIIRLNRNRCQYCRFKKCLAVGMSRDSVRYGRVPKRSRSVEDHSVSSTDSSQDQSALESKQLAIYDIILNISQAHHAHCAITEDKIKNISRNPASLRSKIRIPQGQVFFTNEELEMQRLHMWQQLAYLITPSIHSVVEFSKRVPNFSELSQDDQLILIKTGFFEIWLIRMSRMILKQENLVIFETGSCIPRDELAVVYAPDFVTSMFEMVSSFNMLNLNDTEIGLFTGIVLTTADRQGLSDPSSVERTQDQLVEALQLQISRSHSTEENLFASIIMKAPELRTLGSRHNDLLRWYRSQWHRISLPPLFAEIYDIPKNPMDTQSS